MRFEELITKLNVRKILRETFFLIAIGAVFVMVPLRCGMHPDEEMAHDQTSEATGEISLRERSGEKENFSFWLRDVERRQGPQE